MPYTRPAPVLELNPANTVMTSPVVYPFGTSGPGASIGRFAATFDYTGTPGNLTHSSEFSKIAPNGEDARLTWPSNSGNGLNSGIFTRVFAVKLPATLANSQHVWVSSTNDSSGYNNQAAHLEIKSNFSLSLNKANMAEAINIAGQLTPNAVNSIAITRDGSGGGYIAINNNNAVAFSSQDFLFADYEMLGNHNFRGEGNEGLEIGFYAQSTNSVTAAELKTLSDNPAAIVRQVAAAPADTTPPTLQVLGTNDDGTKVYVTASEALQTSPAPGFAGFSISGSHTITGIAVSGSAAILSVTPAITSAETLTLTHTAGSGSVKDLAGNQLPSFINQPITNGVGAGFWRYLGNEAQTVTVPANSRVRYGITGSYVEQTISGQFTIGNVQFGSDPAPGSVKHADVYITSPATGFTVDGPTVGPVGAESGLFSVAVDGILSTPLIVTPAGAGLTFSPSAVTLSNTNTVATFSAIASGAGTSSITFTNNKGFANPAAKSYEAITSLFKEFGPGKEFATLEAAMDSVANYDPVAAKLMIVIEGSADVASVNRQAKPAQANDSYFYLIRAKAAQSYKALNAGGALHESMTGLTLNIPAGSQLRFGGGVVLEGWKVNITTSEGIKFLNDGAGPLGMLHQCFVLANADNAMSCLAYKGARLEDTLIVRTSAHTGKYFNGAWILKIARCSWIHKGSGSVPTVHDGGWGNGASILDTLYYGFPNNAIDQIDGFFKLNNATSAPLANMQGFELVSPSTILLNPASNYRAGSGVLGKASTYAKSVPDALGNNRGPAPDIGAAQQVAALPLATGAVTAQPAPDGERITVSGTYSGTVNFMTVSFVPAAIPNGAVPQGPFDLTFASGTWTTSTDGVVPGSYAAPQIAMTNDGGTSYVTGAVPFEINGVGGLLMDPGVQEPATAVVLTAPASGLVGVASSQFNVGLNGSSGVVVRVTPNDNAAGGTFNPAYVDLANGNSGSFTYTPSSAGVKNITLNNDKGLANPTPVNYTATVPSVVVPRISLPLTTDGLTVVADMSGLQYAWFDQPLPQNFTVPKFKGNNGAIVGGVFNLNLDGSNLAAGGTGYLVLTNGNGDVAQTPAALVFSGPVKVQ